MPRNRTARVAVLGAAVPRSRPGSFSSRTAAALRRRLVAAALILLSIALITIYFREPSSGGLHQAQSAGATVLRPFEVGAERVARPFRDAYSYTTGLFHAKSENKRLRAEVDALRQQVAQNQTAAQENETLRRLLHYRDVARFPNDFVPVATSVISQPPSDFQQQIVVAVGSADGVRVDSPVVTEDGLVGRVTKVAHRTALVTLLTDQTMNVSAVDVKTTAQGIVRHGTTDTGALTMDRVSRDQVVNEGDTIVTSGWRSQNLHSLYPKGIPIGKVTNVGRSDVDLFVQIQVQPFAHFSSLSSVLVLVPKRR